jgi:hypothetical protein
MLNFKFKFLSDNYQQIFSINNNISCYFIEKKKKKTRMFYSSIQISIQILRMLVCIFMYI